MELIYSIIIKFFYNKIKASLMDLRPANLHVNMVNGEQTALFGANHLRLNLR